VVYYHGENIKSRYFEGWYFKHQTQNTAIAFIPGIHARENGVKSAFIQVITPDFSDNFEFPYERFKADRKNLAISIADNQFTQKGIAVNLENNLHTIRGRLKYGEFIEIKGDAMGPFRYVPFMQCRHGVISMMHNISGSIGIQDRVVDFNGGIGYIETDRGCSFPDRYLWVHTAKNDINPTSVMISVADIPFAGRKFTGCICCIRHSEKEYRLATYNGVKIVKLEKNAVILTQGKYRLEVKVYPSASYQLRAPANGQMSRRIHESVCCKVRTRFYENTRQVFDFESSQAGFEYVN
jgi:hypothetical protein